MRMLAVLLMSSALAGCASMQSLDNISTVGGLNPDSGSASAVEMPIETSRPYLKQLEELNPPSEKIVVGVYNFSDKTGQRKAGDAASASTLSTAITQGAEVWLIQALKSAGRGKWFRVVERVGLDNITKERQIIRQTRQEYEQDKAQPLPPMVFAGAIIEGGVISYEANLRSGGIGARFFGIGADKQYREDQVTVSLRLVNVQTGEVLLTVSTSKTILSYRNDAGVMTYIDSVNRYLEGETGSAENEPVNYAVRTAIESAVVALINQGIEQEVWFYKGFAPPPATPTTPAVNEEPSVGAEEDQITIPPAATDEQQ